MAAWYLTSTLGITLIYTYFLTIILICRAIQCIVPLFTDTIPLAFSFNSLIISSVIHCPILHFCPTFTPVYYLLVLIM
jgi:hypothetical protein